LRPLSCSGPRGEFLVSGLTERHSNLLLMVIVTGAAVMHLVPQVRDYLLTTWMVVGLGGAAFLSLLLLQACAQQGRARRQRFIWPGLAAAGLLVANGIFHIGVALWREEYNTGLGSAIVLFLPVGLFYFRFVRQHCAIGWPGIAGGVLFGAAAHAALLLNIRFNLPAPPAAVFGVVALAPLIANLVYDGLRRAWPLPQKGQKM